MLSVKTGGVTRLAQFIERNNLVPSESVAYLWADDSGEEFGSDELMGWYNREAEAMKLGLVDDFLVFDELWRVYVEPPSIEEIKALQETYLKVRGSRLRTIDAQLAILRSTSIPAGAMDVVGLYWMSKNPLAASAR